MLLTESNVLILVDFLLIGLLVVLWWKVGRTKNKAKNHSNSTSSDDMPIGNGVPSVSEDSFYGGGSGGGAGATRNFESQTANVSVSVDIANQGAVDSVGEINF